MKIFLLFLCASFIIGANWQQTTLQQRRWLMGSVAAVMVTAYFLFDSFI